MKATIKRTANMVKEACTSTLKGASSRLPLHKALQCEHSPIRTVRYWLEMIDLKTFVSVHLVRHNIGVDHFVETNRSDRGGNDTVDRNTPVKHSMDINAQALINISRKRLCYCSAKETVSAWRKVREEVEKTDDVMARFMVPECVYRNGLCPELKMCKPGLKQVLEMYPEWPGIRLMESKK